MRILSLNLLLLFILCTSCESWDLERNDLMQTLCENVNCNNGTCNTETGKCECNENWTGDFCNIPTNPDNPCAGIDCGPNGNCVNGICECTGSWTGTNCDSISTFLKVYGVENKDELGYSVAELPDGNFVIIGEQDGEAYFLKISPKGELIVQKEFESLSGYEPFEPIDRNGMDGTPGNVDPFGRYDIIVDNNSLQILGYKNTNGTENIVLVFVDQDGNFSNNDVKTIEMEDHQRPMSFCQTNTGGFAIAGYSQANYNNDFLLIETNSVGEVIWSKKYGDTYSDILWSVKELDFGTLAICGEKGKATGGSFYFALIDKPSQSIIREAISENGADARAFSMDINSNNEFILFGYSGSFANEQYQWKKYEIGEGFTLNSTTGSNSSKRDIGRSMVIGSSGDIVGCGFSGIGNLFDINLVIEPFDASPIKKEFKFEKEAYNSAWQVIECSDGGYLIVGTTVSLKQGEVYNNKQDSNIIIIKTDSQGNY